MSKSKIKEEEVCSEVPRFLVGLEDYACGELEGGNMKNTSESYDEEEEEEDDLVSNIIVTYLKRWSGEKRSVGN